MVSDVNTFKSNSTYMSSGGNTDVEHHQRDVFTHLYKDAVLKQQKQQQQQQQRQRQQHHQQEEEYMGTRHVSVHNDITPIAPQRKNSILGDPETSEMLPGITPFATNKRIDKLALPRGPDHTTLIPPSPNYGRLLNFTEEEAEENARRRRHHSINNNNHHNNISRRFSQVTIPTCNPRINRLATPKQYMEYTPPVSRRNSSISRKNTSSRGQDERQEYQRPRQRSSTPLRRTQPVFRF
ncbi:uncharacterized protein TM35_000013220 [Trypanosoma theileri]|uniref:Uncharacterized protein n=1 Tax=Trypanosoma theileri TaxID=67003 RepID=A0A1X0P9D9_9TRYP|nr:uncharacterized protein TM35_000013220 [Trypanosoma theileri]ORC93445.1 hypothetical protein TM35_000013220 [Trypanosoma theileri]